MQKIHVYDGFDEMWKKDTFLVNVVGLIFGLC